MAVGPGMVQMQLYTTAALKKRLNDAFGEGRVSANVERILRAHLDNPLEEKKLRLKELNAEVRRFNADYGMRLALMEEASPAPPEEISFAPPARDSFTGEKTTSRS